MSIEEIKQRIEQIEKSIQNCKKGMKQAGSDFTYWGYVSEEQRLSEEKSRLKKDLYYLDLSKALDEFLDSADFGANRLKQELLKILDEHKKLS